MFMILQACVAIGFVKDTDIIISAQVPVYLHSFISGVACYHNRKHVCDSLGMFKITL